jgi:hypothetical protein
MAKSSECLRYPSRSVVDDPLKAASEAVGNRIAAALSDNGEGQLIDMDQS